MKYTERLRQLLHGTTLTLSVAESCTGGRISHLVTLVSGSSEYYLGSVTSYAIPVKEALLGVSGRTIHEKGVVSAEVAKSMAEGVRKLTGSTFSVSTTGLAEGGDGQNPEGTLWIGVSGPEGPKAFKHCLSGSRSENIRHFSQIALAHLVKYIENSQLITNKP